MKHLNQKGFSIHIIIIVVVVVSLIGAVGAWVFLHDKDKVTELAIYTDTAEQFTFEYPKDWTIANQDEEPIRNDTSETAVSRAVNIDPLDGTHDNLISVMPGCETTNKRGEPISVLQDLKASNDSSHTQEESKIGDYTSFYDRTDFNTEAESYVKHTYFVSNGTSCVTFSYTESHQNVTESIDFDESQYRVDFENIVNSIQFL